jgi:hypothetical protein
MNYIIASTTDGLKNSDGSPTILIQKIYRRHFALRVVYECRRFARQTRHLLAMSKAYSIPKMTCFAHFVATGVRLGRLAPSNVCITCAP